MEGRFEKGGGQEEEVNNSWVGGQASGQEGAGGTPGEGNTPILEATSCEQLVGALGNK